MYPEQTQLYPCVPARVQCVLQPSHTLYPHLPEPDLYIDNVVAVRYVPLFFLNSGVGVARLANAVEISKTDVTQSHASWFGLAYRPTPALLAARSANKRPCLAAQLDPCCLLAAVMRAWARI